MMLAKVYSPRTRATESSAALRIAVRMFGTTIRTMIVPQPEPRLRAASDSVFKSIAARPASRDRYAYGMTRMTYANDRTRIESLMLMLIQLYSGLIPTTRAIAGTVSGIRQMNSTARFSWGRRRRTHTIVGSRIASIRIEV